MSLQAYAEASIPLRHMLPTQQSHQRLTTLRDLLPRDVSSPAVSPVHSQASVANSVTSAAGKHAITMQDLHDSSSLAGSLSRTRSTSSSSLMRTHARTFSPPKAEAGSMSPYRRDQWLALVGDGRPASPAGSPLEVPAPPVEPVYSPIGTSSSLGRTRVLSSSGSLLALPGEFKRKAMDSTLGSTHSSVFSFDAEVTKAPSPDDRVKYDHMVRVCGWMCALPRARSARIKFAFVVFRGSWQQMMFTAVRLESSWQSSTCESADLFHLQCVVVHVSAPGSTCVVHCLSCCALLQRMAAQGIMQTRSILRYSPRHGDGKTLDGSFAEMGGWATVLEPLRYKIPPAQPRSPLGKTGSSNNFGSTGGSQSSALDSLMVDAAEADEADGDERMALVSSPQRMQETLKEV